MRKPEDSAGEKKFAFGTPIFRSCQRSRSMDLFIVALILFYLILFHLKKEMEWSVVYEHDGRVESTG